MGNGKGSGATLVWGWFGGTARVQRNAVICQKQLEIAWIWVSLCDFSFLGFFWLGFPFGHKLCLRDNFSLFLRAIQWQQKDFAQDGRTIGLSGGRSCFRPSGSQQFAPMSLSLPMQILRTPTSTYSGSPTWLSPKQSRKPLSRASAKPWWNPNPGFAGGFNVIFAWQGRAPSCPFPFPDKTHLPVLENGQTKLLRVQENRLYNLDLLWHKIITKNGYYPVYVWVNAFVRVDNLLA